MNKEEIINQVRRMAAENGCKPLGRGRFEAITGINKNAWLKYWSRFSELQKEAGFEPNQLTRAYDDEYLIEKIILLIRELGQFPTHDARRTKSFNDPDFPSAGTFDRLGGNDKLIIKILAYCQGKPDYEDITKIIQPLVKQVNSEETSNNNDATNLGFVYLVKGHPGEYKIGRTNLVDRRLSELGATASVEQELIHDIKTDDPAGIEAYWHRRFQEKRMRGEWFKLSPADVRIFKRWRRIY